MALLAFFPSQKWKPRFLHLLSHSLFVGSAWPFPRGGKWGTALSGAWRPSKEPKAGRSLETTFDYNQGPGEAVTTAAINAWVKASQSLRQRSWLEKDQSVPLPTAGHLGLLALAFF